jgi:hypothetical protein
MPDVTLVNLNVLCVRYLDRTEREVHLSWMYPEEEPDRLLSSAHTSSMVRSTP